MKVPPRAEQEAIITYLDEAVGRISKAITAPRREIELLREYRTRQLGPRYPRARLKAAEAPIDQKVLARSPKTTKR